MTDKRGDFASRAAGGVAALLAGYFARKLITRGWTRVTGKQPPEHPEDPEVGIAEALGWAIVTGVGVEAARLLANRAAARRLHGPDIESDSG
jgi:Protein of unknown function (DUF4235)